MRILGQCSQKDLDEIEHLAVALDNPEMLDTSTLTSRQKFAFHFLAVTIDKKIPYKLVRATIQEVLFWGENDTIRNLEVKLQKTASEKDLREFKMRYRGQW